MEKFIVERKGNQVFFNREPETQLEWRKFKNIIEDAIVHALLTESPCVIYPSKELDEPQDTVI